MNIDFFSGLCQEPLKTEKVFGICDDQTHQVAYTNTDDPSRWIAEVTNKSDIKVRFTAIDNCIVIMQGETQDEESTCDGMLTFNKSLYLVELKNQRRGGWLPNAIKQLKNTIRLLTDNDSLENIQYKKAYACNRKHPQFTTIDNELSKRFFKETNGFRIDAQNKIVIK